MKALIIQHEESTPPGSTKEWLENRNIGYTLLFSHEIIKNQTIHDFDFLIICGGSMNVDQENLHPWLKNEKELISYYVEKNKKIVGLCLGGQLLAEILGGEVHQLPFWEVGWQKIKLENEKPLFVFQWHSYAFSLPPYAHLLASSEAWPIQAFSYGKNILAVQYHPETTVEWALECAADPNVPLPSQFVQSSKEIESGVVYQKEMQEWYFKQLDLLIQ